MDCESSRRGGRPRKGSLYWTKSGWRARITVDVDGVAVQKSFDLKTTDKQAARIKLRRLVKAHGSPSELAAEAVRPETFEEAAVRVLDAQKAAGLATWKDRDRRLKAYALPLLGALPCEVIRASNVREVLEVVRHQGKSRQTMIHVKNDISIILGELWREELIPENVCSRVVVPEALPAAAERSKKERAVLTDEELVRYLSWQHPEEHQRLAVLERQTMACVARMFGGQRTSDLHSARWDGFELPGFAWGTVPRRKGRRLAKGGRAQRLFVPEPLRPILEDWWMRAGKPTSGLVFPRRKGFAPGEDAREAARKHSSHAEAFRRDLARAFGLEVLKLVETKRSNGRKLARWRWVAAEREMTARERTLLEETEYTLPVDFHSWRRAFNQALAEAGVNAQQAQALAGHASMAAHERYLRNTEKMRTLPAGALPNMLIPTPGVSASSVLKLASGDHESAVGVAGFEPATAGTQSRPSTRLRYTPKVLLAGKGSGRHGARFLPQRPRRCTRGGGGCCLLAAARGALASADPVASYSSVVSQLTTAWCVEPSGVKMRSSRRFGWQPATVLGSPTPTSGST